MLRHFVGVTDAVNDGEGRKYGQNPENRGHRAPAIKERAQDDEHDALRSLHEADLALTDQRLGAGAGVAHHKRRDHDEGGQHDVEESVAAGVKHQQPEEEYYVGVAVDDGIEKCAEDRDLVGLAGNASVHHVEDAGADDDQGGINEHAYVIVLIGVTEKNGGGGVDDESDKREDVGRDAREREAIDDGLQQHSASAPKSAGPRFMGTHFALFRFVMNS